MQPPFLGMTVSLCNVHLLLVVMEVGGGVLGDAALWGGGLIASYTRKMFNEDGK